MSNQEMGLELTDKDRLDIILELEKNMSNNYSIAMNEASNEDLYENYFDMFTSIKDSARDIFEYMKYSELYKLEYVEDKKIDKKLNCLSEKLNNLEK